MESLNGRDLSFVPRSRELYLGDVSFEYISDRLKWISLYTINDPSLPRVTNHTRSPLLLFVIALQQLSFVSRMESLNDRVDRLSRQVVNGVK